MAKRPKAADPEQLRSQLVELLSAFKDRLATEPDLRRRVLDLVPIARSLNRLGISIGALAEVSAARDRILRYLQSYPTTVITGEELAVVSGISEYARRIRELRVQFGWPIYSGVTARQMVDAEASDGQAQLEFSVASMRPDDYILIGEQDTTAAGRWTTANRIRRSAGSVQDRLLAFLRANVGVPVTGEELRYVAKNATEWARRSRELRTEEGWPVQTRNTGRPDLAIGVYVLEADRQLEIHDRQIADSVRVAVLERDGFQCRYCGWNPAERKDHDPRTLLELHHVVHHVVGGSNDENNLLTLCNVHHDDVHRLRLTGAEACLNWLAQGAK